jgi:SpoVK/Ycf46/Vps4 family AAA+-type ATPase
VNTDEALVQVARLGLKGDKASLGRYLRRFLKNAATDKNIAQSTKQSLAELVADNASSTMRFAEPNQPDSFPFLSIEEVAAGDEPLLSSAVARELDAILNEHNQVDALTAVGLSPTRTLLLTGAPGVGKTICARSVARRLALPLYRVDVAALMSSFLGKTGQNLVDVFAHARESPTVLFLDEFDAIAKRRDDPSDVGELKRIVNVLLIELEAWPSHGLVVAATNHPELLDRAIWRRFEKVIAIGLPTTDVRRALLTREFSRLAKIPSKGTLEAIVEATDGISGSDLAAFARACVRRVVLDDIDIDKVASQELLARLREQVDQDPAARVRYCRIATKHLDLSQREIGAELGISHVMVGKLLKQDKATSNVRRS